MPAIVGFIAVFGVAVQNGMVMVSYINKLRSFGMGLNEAVITGASVRLRAELLSALIGSISLIPFIISSGTGAEIEKPLAIVVVGGLVTRPINELRQKIGEELRRRESPDALVPIDRDPVPPQFAEGVRRYYERLGSGR